MSKITIINKFEAHIAIFDAAKEFLREMREQLPDLTDAEFRHNFDHEQEFNDITDACRRLFSSLQNRGMMPRVIKFETANKEKISQLLFHYDPNKILERYKCLDSALLKSFNKQFGPFHNIESKKNLWRQFARGVISGSKFMTSFKTKNDFDEFVGTFDFNKYTKAALPMLLSREINGLGFALACDFLKELGYINYPKPDVHLIKIFCGIGLSGSTDPYDIYKSIIEMAEDVSRAKKTIMEGVQTSAYVVDKIFWMIGSAKLVPGSDRSMGRNYRAEFIKRAKLS